MAAGTFEPMPPNPWFSWDYVTNNWSEISTALIQHATITIQAVLIALVVAIPLAALAHEVRWLAAPVLGTASVLYTIPSLALFAILVPFTGIGRLPVLIGLVLYALLILVRNALTGLDGVDPDVRDAARGMGYGRWRMLGAVEMPNALPSIVTGVRLATVSTVALVTVGFIAGYGGLGTLMFRGFNSNYHAQIMTATLLCVLLAVVLDVAVYLAGRLLTPWARGERRRARRSSPSAMEVAS